MVGSLRAEADQEQRAAEDEQRRAETEGHDEPGDRAGPAEEDRRGVPRLAPARGAEELGVGCNRLVSAWLEGPPMSGTVEQAMNDVSQSRHR
jgi:hypothetical protein